MKRVPKRSPAISIGVMIAWNFLVSVFSKPRVSRLTFSFVDNTPSSLSFNIGSINPPILSSSSSVIGSIPSDFPTPRTFPFRLITSTLEFRISRITLQMSLNTTLLELLLCNNFPILRVLSNSCTLLIYFPPSTHTKKLPDVMHIVAHVISDYNGNSANLWENSDSI